MKRVLYDDFSSFKLGAFPYDHDHSAMGEYHYYPEIGYKGQWFDPIANFNYRGPSWLITDPLMDGSHMMEQQRVTSPDAPKGAMPALRAGDVRWKNYRIKAEVRVFTHSEPCGILFHYQTSMMHYGFFLTKTGAELHRVDKMHRVLLASSPVLWNEDDFHLMEVEVKNDSYKCYLDGTLIFNVSDDVYTSGCIALSACMPTQYKTIEVEMEDDDYAAYEKAIAEEKAKVERLRSEHSRPKAIQKIDLKDFGAGRQLRFGHLTGTDELFFVICQPELRVFKDRYPYISAMTAVSLETGKVLWQIGEPRDSEDVIELTTDLPFQIYDIDGDGIDEVITSWDFKLFILDGRTGKVKKSAPTPLNVEPPESVTSLEFGRYAFNRLNVDAIRIVNVSGNARAEEILIKDRYSRIWIYDKNLSFKWKFSKYNTGHFPFSYDFDGDGRDELFSCYNMVDDDGKLLWSLPITVDHTDEIIVGRINPDIDEDIIAIVSGWEGFMLVRKNGDILVRDINGHGQRISAGNYIPENKGLEICTTTYWGNNGIIYMHDSRGRDIWHREMLANGNMIAPVNWDGTGVDLLLLNASPVHGGLIDGYGNVVVELPDDGHPTLCSEVEDVYGDERDELIFWDRKSLWVYTQDGPSRGPADRIYKPLKYPMYNGSNYRGEYNFPNWIEK